MRATKPILLQIYNILKNYSSPDKPLTQQQIIDKLYEDYGVACERKAVSRNISYLKDFYNVESGRNGAYLVPDEPLLESYEIRLLIDSVLGSKHIGPKYSKDLIDKLVSLGEPDLKKHLKHIRSVNEWSKLDNKDFFLNIDVIGEAIEQKRQISFDYNTVNTQKKLVKKETLYGTPYAMLLNNQRYYLVIRNEKYKDVGYLRMDRITNARVLDEPAVPITDNVGFERGLNYHELTTCLPYMFTGKPVDIEMKCDKGFVKDLMDWFGDGFRTRAIDENNILVKVKASEQAMVYWAMQYNTNVEVLSPASLREEIKDTLRATLAMYE